MHIFNPSSKVDPILSVVFSYPTISVTSSSNSPLKLVHISSWIKTVPFPSYHTRDKTGGLSYLERFVVGSFITIQSMTSPYRLKYCRSVSVTNTSFNIQHFCKHKLERRFLHTLWSSEIDYSGIPANLNRSGRNFTQRRWLTRDFGRTQSNVEKIPEKNCLDWRFVRNTMHLEL